MTLRLSERRLPAAITLIVIVVAASILLWNGEGPYAELVGHASTSSPEPAPRRAVQSDESQLHAIVDPNASSASRRVDDAPSTRRVFVTVLDAEGRGLEGVKVQGIDEDLQVETTSTDEAGRAQLNHPNSGWIVARPPAMPPLTARVRPGEDDYVLQLEVGVEIHGQVLVDGHPASRARLGAHITTPKRSSVPDRVINRLSAMTSPKYFEVTADVEGRFQLKGLGLGDVVWLVLPQGTELARGTSNPGYNQEHVGPLVDDVTAVVVRAVTTRVLEGRCMDADGQPVAGVEVRVTAKSPDGVISASGLSRSEEDGVFRVAVPPSVWDRRLPAVVEARWGGLTLTQSAPDQPWSGKAFLADFVFPRGVLLTVTIEDEEGQPIPQAHVGIRGQDRPLDPTGSDGTTTLELAPDSLVTLEIAAFGYEFRRLEMRQSEGRTERIIRLVRASQATIVILDDEGRPVPTHGCGLAAPSHILRDPSAWESPAFRATMPGIGPWKQGTKKHVSGITDTHGRIILYDLADDVALEAVTYGMGMIPLAHDGPHVIHRGSAVNFVLRLPTGSKALRGVVIDEQGNPIRDAAVQIGTTKRGGSGRLCVTDAEGRFRFDEILTDHIFLHAYRVGYLAVDRFLENLSSHVDPLPILLRKARACDVEIRRANGDLAREASLEFARYPKRDGPFIRRRGDGTFKIMNLDDAPRRLLVGYGGAPEILVTLNPVRERLKVVHLPPTGLLRVRWTREPHSKEAIMYRTEGVPRAIISWIFERSSAELRLPEGHYEIGRARKIEGHYEFVGETKMVDVHTGCDIPLWID